MVLTYIRPDADDTDGTWTNESDSGSNLFASIDETVASDADYIKSVHLPDHDICKIRLSDPSGMVMRPATVHYRFKKRGETTQQINIDVSLLQGSTEIAKWTETDISTSYVDGSQTLTLAQFNSISDFNNLYIQFDASSSWWLAASEVDLWFEDNLYHLSTALSSAHLLLHCDGADAATGVGAFIDATGRHQVTVAGSAQVDTAQSKFGGASYLGSSGSYISSDGGSDFSFGTGDFTIDCWIRPTTLFRCVFSFGVDGAGLFPGVIGAGTGEIRYFDGTTYQITSAAGAIVANTWYHLAVTRSGTSTRLFLNGVQQGSTYTDSSNYTTGGAGYPRIGALGGTGLEWDGWIDEFRILKGTAAWTTTFTPPTAPYNVALSGPYAHLSCSRASVGYATTSSGTLTAFASNALRITDLGLLVEDARTNFCIQSQQLDTSTSPWNSASGNRTITLNTTVAPDGTTTADSLAFGAGDNSYQYCQDTVSNGTATYTISVWMKGTAGDKIGLRMVCNGSGSDARSVALTLTTDWVRYTLSGSINVTDANIDIGFENRTSVITGVGGGAKTVIVWGVQLELGSFESSYIATVGTSQTRAADQIATTGSLSTLLGPTPVSMVVDFLRNGFASAGQPTKLITDGGGADVTLFYASSAGDNQLGSDFVSSTASLGGGLTWSVGAKGGFSNNASNASIVGGGGTVVTTATTASVPFTPQYIGYDNYQAYRTFGIFRRLTVWNTKLADADLQTMTDPAHTINFTTDEAAIDLDFANAAYNAIALPYDFLSISRASVGYAQTVAGTLQLFGANQLRITDKGLLVEDARTNYALQSQTFSGWTLDDVTIATASTTAPDGTTTASKLVEAATTQDHRVYYNSLALTTAVPKTFSIYLKAAGRTSAIVALSDTVSTATIGIDLSNGSTWQPTDGHASWSNISSVVEALANGWYRVALIGTTANTNILPMVWAKDSTSGQTNDTYLGDITKGVYVWGAQVEDNASFASSYIPTTSGSQSRAADLVTCIGSFNTLLSNIPQSVVADVKFSNADVVDNWAIIGDSTSNLHLLAGYTAGDNLALALYNNINSSLVLTIGNSLTMSGGAKVGASQATAQRSGVAGGGTVQTDTNTALPMATGALGTKNQANTTMYGYIRRVTVWNTKLADATLQGFTNP